MRICWQFSFSCFGFISAKMTYLSFFTHKKVYTTVYLYLAYLYFDTLSEKEEVIEIKLPCQKN